MPKLTREQIENRQKIVNGDIPPIVKYLRSIRIDKQMTQKELAELLGCSPTHVNQMELGLYEIKPEEVGRWLYHLDQSLEDGILNVLHLWVKDVAEKVEKGYEQEESNCNKHVVNDGSGLRTESRA